MIQSAVEILRQEGIQIGRQEGMKEGRQEGIEQVAANLLQTGMDPELVVKVTQLSESQIQKLHEQRDPSTSGQPSSND